MNWIDFVSGVEVPIHQLSEKLMHEFTSEGLIQC